MNAWSFKGERHKEVPKISLKGDYFLDQGGILKLKQPIIKDETQPDGTIKSHFIFSNDPEQIGKWIKEGGMASWLGRSPSVNEQKYFKKLIKQAVPIPQNAQPQPFSANLNLQEQYRSSSHTILKCLGFFLPNWVSDNLTKPVRQFARYNQGDWQLFAVNVEQLISFAEQAAQVSGLGVHHNSVEIYWCSSLRMIVGVLTILRRVKRAVVIAQGYSGPDAILYVSEDTHGSKMAPEAIYVEFDSRQFSLPLLGVQYFAYPNEISQFFTNECAGLTEIYYPIDANTASLSKEFEVINERNHQLDQTTLEDYSNLFLKYFSNLGKIKGISVEPARLHSKLFEYGFSTLASRFIGKPCTDPKVVSCVVSAFERVMKELCLGLL